MQEDRCPECGGEDIREDGGEKVCGGCGLVLDDNPIDHGPDWRVHDAEEWKKRSRTGSPMTVLRHDGGLTTEISGGKDGAGKSMTPRQKARLYRLRKWHARSRVNSGREWSLVKGLNELNRIADAHELPEKAKEAAAVIYRTAAGENLIIGRGRTTMACASLFIACRQCSVPRTLEEISRDAMAYMSGRRRAKSVNKAVKVLSRELGIRIRPAGPAEYVPRVRSSLGLGRRVEITAREILEEFLEKEGDTGRKPMALVGAAVYMASVLEGEKKTQFEVAEVTGVSGVAIRNTYKEMAQNLTLTLPP